MKMYKTGMFLHKSVLRATKPITLSVMYKFDVKGRNLPKQQNTHTTFTLFHFTCFTNFAQTHSGSFLNVFYLFGQIYYVSTH